MIRDKAAGACDWHAVSIWKNRANHQARDSERGARLVALEARVAALEPRMGDGLLIERVETNGLLRIYRGELEDLAGTHETDRYVIAEVERARRMRSNERGLKTGFRKYQHLRRAGDIQRLEYGRQIAEFAVVLERRFAFIDALLKDGHRIVDGPGCILNCLVVER